MAGTLSTAVDRTAALLVEALERELALERDRDRAVAWPPPPAPGWAHLPAILIDLVYNLSRDYERVTRPAIRRYAEHAVNEFPHLGDTQALLQSYAATGDAGHRPHTLEEALSLLTPMTTAERTALFGVGDLPAYRRTSAPRRADTVVTLMENVLRLGINTAEELHIALGTSPPEVRRAVQFRTPGIGNAGWAYLPLLVDQESVKRDVHVDRYLAEHLEQPVNDEEVEPVFLRASEMIAERTGQPSTIRGLEHFIWRVQSGKPPLEPA